MVQHAAENQLAPTRGSAPQVRLASGPAQRTRNISCPKVNSGRANEIEGLVVAHKKRPSQRDRKHCTGSIDSFKMRNHAEDLPLAAPRMRSDPCVAATATTFHSNSTLFASSPTLAIGLGDVFNLSPEGIGRRSNTSNTHTSHGSLPSPHWSFVYLILHA